MLRFLSFALLNHMTIGPVEQLQRLASVLRMCVTRFPSGRKDVKWCVSKMESDDMTTHPLSCVLPLHLQHIRLLTSMFFIPALVLFCYFTPPFLFCLSTFSEFTPCHSILLLLASITALL